MCTYCTRLCLQLPYIRDQIISRHWTIFLLKSHFAFEQAIIVYYGQLKCKMLLLAVIKIYVLQLLHSLQENPSLFIPHLAGQLLVVTVKILNALLLLVPINAKAIGKLSHKIPAIILMSFNWLQEFCVFRQYLCICDL